MLFSELPLNPKLLKGIEALGFKSPTPVQEATIGTLIEQDQDLIGLALSLIHISEPTRPS